MSNVMQKNRWKNKALALGTVAVLALIPMTSMADMSADDRMAGGKVERLVEKIDESIPVSPRTASSMQASLIAGAVQGVRFEDSVALRDFYQSRDGQFFWLSGMNDRRAKALLDVLNDSWTHGLNPDQYHVALLESLLNEKSADQKPALELLLSDAFVRYAHDMTGMRVNPATVKQRASDWGHSVSAHDALVGVEAADDTGAALRSLAPQDDFYGDLRREFTTLYKKMAAEKDSGKHVKVSIKGTLKPGQVDSAVPKLRRRLGVHYDSAYGGEMFYDDRLAAAVMTFQRQSGLEADGVIGQQTVALLNRNDGSRLEQLAANMERLRWMDRVKPDRYILVNIPSQLLWTVENGRAENQMNVIVGRKDRPTKSFRADIQGIRFNPTWTVPAGIKAKDFLPHLQEDPTYLDQKGMELYDTSGGSVRNIDPASVDWATVSPSDLGSYRMVQAAGDNNALGQIRVLMSNPYDIYLHDTSSPALFNQSERLLSSGCVRVSQPEVLAKFVLAHNENWSEEKMTKILSSHKTVEISAEEHIPVFIVYQTIWPDRQGNLVYGSDIYGNDNVLIKALKDKGELKLPSLDRLPDNNDKSGKLASVR